MGANEIVEDPVGIESGLQSGLLFGIGIGPPAIAGDLSPEGTVESLRMIGMNVVVF